MRIALCQLNTTVSAFIHNVDEYSRSSRSRAERTSRFSRESSVLPADRSARSSASTSPTPRRCSSSARHRENGRCPKAVIQGIMVARARRPRHPQRRGGAARRRNRAHPAKRLLPTYDVSTRPGTSKRAVRRNFGPRRGSRSLGLRGRLVRGHLLWPSAPPPIPPKSSGDVVNISASPFEINKRAQAALAGFVNASARHDLRRQVGANDEILFDGGSLVYSAEGAVLYRCPASKRRWPSSICNGKTEVKELSLCSRRAQWRSSRERNPRPRRLGRDRASARRAGHRHP